MKSIGTASLPLLAAGLLLSACSDGSPVESGPTVLEVQGPSGFAGTVDGTNAFIAILVGSEEAVVYLCNGDENLFEWFRGPISDPTLIELTNDAGAAVNANFSGTSFAGSVTLGDGTVHAFSATPNSGSDVGIVRVVGDEADDAEIVAGWILTAQDERGAFLLRRVFMATPRLRDLKDGTSNTIMVGEVNVRITRLSVTSGIISPNN